MNSHVELLGDLESASSNWQLFRYMKLSTLLLLLDGKVFFPSVANLCKGDQFEGRLFCDPAWLVSELSAASKPKKSKRRQLVSWLKKRGCDWERKVLKPNVNEENPQFRSHILSQIYLRELRERRAAWCWFNDDLESAGMWSVYGHAGVAVRTSLSAVVSALPSSRRFHIARMRYVDRRPCTNDAFDAEGHDRELILRPHLLKAIEYKHENEIRVVTQCPANRGGVLVEQLDWRALIDEIIISPLLPSQEAAAIKSMLKAYKWKKTVRIERSKLLPDNSMDADDKLCEAIRQENGGCYEQGLPSVIAEL